MNLERLYNKALIRILPGKLGIVRKAILREQIRTLRFRGDHINFKGTPELIRPKGLCLGHHVTINSRVTINATAGVMLGDNCIIGDDIKINTVKGPGQYEPVVIAAGNKLKSGLTSRSLLESTLDVSGLSSYDGQIIFVLSTGRSGSKAIANSFDKHPEAIGYHDTFPHIYVWALDYLYQRRSEEKIEHDLRLLYNAADMSLGRVHCQSDQKLAPLVPVLARLFPAAKFIWLVRSADGFLGSSYPRGWFRNSEFKLDPNPEEFFSQKAMPSQFDADHRVNGYLLNEFSKSEWNAITAFERLCWYWTYWNNMIEEHLGELSPSRSIRVNLDDLDSSLDKIYRFAGLENVDVSAERMNSAKYEKINQNQWSDEMRDIYRRYCSSAMNKWFDAKN